MFIFFKNLFKDYEFSKHIIDKTYEDDESMADNDIYDWLSKHEVDNYIILNGYETCNYSKDTEHYIYVRKFLTERETNKAIKIF